MYIHTPLRTRNRITLALIEFSSYAPRRRGLIARRLCAKAAFTICQIIFYKKIMIIRLQLCKISKNLLHSKTFFIPVLKYYYTLIELIKKKITDSRNFV